MKFENFSAHAITRLKERTKLSPFELNYLLTKGAYVNLGAKPGINKEHLLFYSVRDDNCFVAVNDSLTGGIITVWLVEYHENLCWAVTDEQKAEAKELAENASKYIPMPATVYWVSAGYTDSNGRPKVCLLNKQPIESFNWSIKDSKDDLLAILKSKKTDVATFDWVSIRAGKNGDFTVIRL